MTGLFLRDTNPFLSNIYEDIYDVNKSASGTIKELSFGLSALDSVHDYSNNYGYMVYAYGSSVMNYYLYEMLDGDSELMLDILETYYNEYKYEEATVDDFLSLVERESGVEGSKDWLYAYLDEFQEIPTV